MPQTYTVRVCYHFGQQGVLALSITIGLLWLVLNIAKCMHSHLPTITLTDDSAGFFFLPIPV